MTFADTVRYLFSLGPELKTIKWDLDRIEALLAELGNPQEGQRYIHVAGTNGKGSVCAMLESSLRTAGYRTGLYTSPHLVDPRERIRIAGAWLSEHAWVSAFERVYAAAERLLVCGTVEAPPSFFETLTAMAFVAFAEADVDVVVLETGLGGRLDATNVVTPELTVITPIDFDHEAFLGSSLELIAGEKAGILKAGCPTVFAEQRTEAIAVLQAKATELGISVVATPPIDAVRLDRHGSDFMMAGLAIRCPLAGAHQVGNTRTAIAALLAFGVEPEFIVSGIAATKWPGRLELAAKNPDIILDGAHNPAGARALAAYIREFFHDEPIRLIFGAMRDKALDEVVGSLFPLAAEVIVTAPAQPRALNAEAILEIADHPNCRAIGTLPEALRYAQENPMTTFVSGSLFLVGEARALLVPGPEL
jgi:dihydrofolate synthase/folylpolyglutamate synthase